MGKLLEIAKGSHTVSSSFSKGKLHSAYDLALEIGISDDKRSSFKSFFRKPEFEKLNENGIITGLKNQLLSMYAKNGNIDGLVTMGFTRHEAKEEIQEYHHFVSEKCIRIRNEHPNEIAQLQEARKIWFSTPSDNEETEFDIDKRCDLNEYAAGKDGFRPFIQDSFYIYTNTFGKFLMGNYDFLTKTETNRIEAILKSKAKIDAAKSNYFLHFIVGKKTSDILTKTKKMTLSTFPPIYIERNSAQSHFFNLETFEDYLKYCELNKNIKSKIKKEISKLIYQYCSEYILPYHRDNELNEVIDFKYLIKYKLLKTEMDILADKFNSEEYQRNEEE